MAGQRIGFFNISRELIENDPESCLVTLAGVLVLRAEAAYEADGRRCECIRYTGIHEDFRPIELGDLVPTYSAVMTRRALSITRTWFEVGRPHAEG